MLGVFDVSFNKIGKETETKKRTHLQPHGLLGQESLVFGIIRVVNDVGIWIDVGRSVHERPE